MSKTKNEKISDSMKGNKNAEIWTFEESEKFLLDAIIESNAKETRKISGADVETYKNDFLGEVARELDQYHQLFDYLVSKFPKLSPLYKKLLNNLETNCFLNAKKGYIKEASAIMNLKSNYKWRDRIDNTSGDAPIQPISLDPETAKAISKRIDDSM